MGQNFHETISKQAIELKLLARPIHIPSFACCHLVAQPVGSAQLLGQQVLCVHPSLLSPGNMWVRISLGGVGSRRQFIDLAREEPPAFRGRDESAVPCLGLE